MKNSTFSAQVANNLSKVLQGYTKGIRFIALLTMLCTIGVGSAWAETIFSDNFANVGTGSSTSVNTRTGWSGFSKCYVQNNSGIRMGTSSATGSITKSAMTNISGTTTLTVTFYLAKYNTDGGKMNITVSGGGTASTTQFTPAGNAGVTSTSSAANWEDKYKCTFTIENATSATKITFATSSKRLILGPVTISTPDSDPDEPVTPEKTATSLTWSAATYTATVGETNTFPTLTTTPADLTGVTYTSSNTSVATVNASTGAITLVAAGSTTITASYAGNETYEAATDASYTLTVNAAQGGGDPETPGTGGTGTINFNNSAVKINAANVTGADNLGNTWTVTTVGTTSYTGSTNYYQVGKSTEPATSITFTTTLPANVNITAFSAKFGGFSGTAGTVTLKVGDTSVGTGSLNASTDVIINNSSQATGKKLTVTVTGIAKGVKAYYISYTYKPTSGGGDPETPVASLTATPTTVDFGTIYQGTTVENKTVAVNFENLTGNVTYSGLESPFTATGTISTTGDQITIAADASTIGEYSQTLTIASTADSKTAEVTVTMNVIEKPAPTGTFTLHTGALIEGDYVIYYSGKAMKAVVSSDRLGYEEVTPSGNDIIDPLASTIWHIAPSGSNWTIYNDNKGYAAGTGTKSQAQLVANLDGDNAKKAAWTVTGTDTYEFTNVWNTEKGVNATLRNNTTYGFACYATSTGGTLTLYRKAGTKYNVTISATTNGTVTASPTSAEAGATIALTVTPDAGYVLDALTVTDASSNTVTVTDNTFTMPASDVTVTATFKLNEKPAATLTLSKNGETEDITGNKQDDVITLPTTIDNDCVKQFVGWSADANCATAPEYAPGASYTLTSTSQTLYAVYATVGGGEETTVSVDMETYATDNSWGSSSSDGQKEIVINSDVKAVISEGGNSGKYYNDGVRIYQSENATVTVSTTAGELKSVKFTFTIANDGTLLHEGVAMTSKEAVEVSGTSAVFSVGDTHATDNKGQVRFTAIEVVYTGNATYSDYSTTCSAAPQAPTFSVGTGTYNSVQTVTITAEDGATIYYTLDGTAPTTASTVYSSALTINETTTLKAIAVKDEVSSAITSATYTINLPLTTMDQIFAKATAVGSTATAVEITFNNWVVTGVATNNKNVYVTDGTKGFIIFNNDGNHGFVVGNVLSGTASCKVQLFKGSAELTELTSATTGLSVTTGGSVTPVVVNDVATLSGVNTGSIVKINGICQSENSKYYINGVQLYNSLFTYENPTIGATYDVTGVYLQYDETKEVLPRTSEDIVKTKDLVTATISVADISLELEKQTTIEATITPDAAKNTVTYTIKSGSEYITLNGTTITAKAVGTATITATIPESTGNYYGATEDFTVTVTPKNIATIPFAFDGGFAEIEKTLGISQNGLTEDYGSSPKLKFDGTGDYVIIHFDSEPGILSYDIKGNGFSDGTFTVQESADGNTYTDLVNYTKLAGSTSTQTHTLSSTSRYVKFIYTTKSSGNVALGNIKIYGPASQLAAPTGLNATDITHNSATLSWNAVANASSYAIIVMSGDETIDLTTTSTTLQVSDLTAETIYLWTVKAIGDSIQYLDSKESETGEFTTTAAPIITYAVTLDPNYPIGETGTFIDTLENSVVGNLEIPFSAGTDSIAIASLYKSIALDGYIFEGWYTAADGGSKRVTTGTISANITFYAHWKVPYTVTFITGTSTTIEPITETTADGIKLPAATLVDCSNWVFLGWADAPVEDETTKAPASILASGSTYKPEGDITLYAVYKRVVDGGGESTTATLTFDDTSKRTTFTTEQQVWTENRITLTNNKASSGSNMGDFINPARFYKSSEIIIEAPGNITQIVASTSGAEYTTALQSSVGPEASATSNVVTITPTASSNTYTINLTAGQTRLSSITVTYGGSLSTSYYHSTPLCQVTITYYGFGGGYTTDCETDPNAIVITKGDTYQIPNCEPTDYDNTLNRTFAGTWNTKANGKGTAYKPGDEFIVNSSITLYAQWTLNTTGNTTLPTGEELLANTDIVVTGGNTLTLQAGTTTIKSLTLKGGLQEGGTYAMPVINIPEGATLVRNSNKINLDLKVNNQSYYPFAVPFEVMNDKDYIHYLDTNLNKVATYSKHYQVLTYDGALRAENGVHDKNWTEVNRHDAKKPSYLVPGKGYAISAVPAAGKDTVTIRISMSVDNKWLANGEQYQLDTITRNQIAVSAHTGTATDINNGGHQRHAGWNFVANPYLTNFTANENISGAGYINGKIIINNGEYSYGGEDVPYVTIPTYNFAHYYQLKLSEATLSPAYGFFVQVGDSGTMSFADKGRQAAPASLAARSAEERPVKMDVDITLSDNHRSDATGLIICDRYTDEYEIGRDLEKMFGNANNLSVYTLMADNTPLAFQALAIRSSMQVIPVGYRTPEQGEYTFALNEATSSIDLLNEQYEQLVLVDYQTGELTNLLIADYTFYSERVQSDSRFALYAVPRQNAPTDLPNVLGNGSETQKVLHNGHLYILHNGSVYNGNGQIVK